MSETDEHGSVGTSRKSTGRGQRSRDGTVEEAEEESDGQMEEADGLDN
jgi:hypothetical protein